MGLIAIIRAIWPDAITNGWIKVFDFGSGPEIPAEGGWDAAALGMSREEGLARIAAYNSLSLVRNGYVFSCTDDDLIGQSVKIEVLEGGKVVGASQKGPLVGNAVAETILAPEAAGTFTVRFSMNALPYATGELEVTF
jgi:hypothetical protein